jgi:hypothetical protein
MWLTWQSCRFFGVFLMSVLSSSVFVLPDYITVRTESICQFNNVTTGEHTEGWSRGGTFHYSFKDGFAYINRSKEDYSDRAGLWKLVSHSFDGERFADIMAKYEGRMTHELLQKAVLRALRLG